MVRRPPTYTHTDTLVPDSTLFRSPASRAPNLFGDLGIAVATLGEIADLGHKIDRPVRPPGDVLRSEEHTSELQSLMRISYAVFCLKKKTHVTMQLCTANAGQHTTETHNH